MELNNVFWGLGIFIIIVVLLAVGTSRFQEKTRSDDAGPGDSPSTNSH